VVVVLLVSPFSAVVASDGLVEARGPANSGIEVTARVQWDTIQDGLIAVRLGGAQFPGP
jgi:hypothetical protein